MEINSSKPPTDVMDTIPSQSLILGPHGYHLCQSSRASYHAKSPLRLQNQDQLYEIRLLHDIIQFNTNDQS